MSQPATIVSAAADMRYKDLLLHVSQFAFGILGLNRTGRKLDLQQ